MLQTIESDPSVNGSIQPWMGLQMAEHDAFLRAIRQEPDDDCNRLVYADFLEETGEATHLAHADLIRNQIEEAHLADDCARRRRLRHHNRQLLRKHESEWIGPLGEWSSLGIHGPRPTWMFQRGFIESVSLDAGIFNQVVDLLFDHYPIRELQIHNIGTHPGIIDSMAKCEHLQRVRALRFTMAPFNQAGLGDAGLERLLASPFISQLNELSVERQRLSNVAVRLIAQCPNLTNLHTLRLGYNRPSHQQQLSIDSDSMPILVASPYLRNLRNLDLSHLDIGVEGIEAIADSTMLESLTDLNLQRCDIGALGLVAVATSRTLQNLERLNLRNNRLGVRAAQALASSATLRKVRFLDLSSNRVTDNGIIDLVRSGNAQALQFLILRRNRLGDRAAEALANSENLIQLLTLDLRHNQLTVDGAKAIANSHHFDQLEHLDLRGNGIPQPHRTEVRKLLGKKFGRL